MAYVLRLSRCFLVSILIPAAMLTAQTTHDASELLHRVYIASGGDAWKPLAQAEAEGSMNVGGLTGHFHQFIDLKRGRDVSDFAVGPMKGRQSTQPDFLWTSDASGLINVQDSPTAKSDAITQSFQDRNGWFDAPENQLSWIGKRKDHGVKYTLIAVTPIGGRRLTLWINNKTLLIERIEQLDSNHHANTNYLSDYRTVNGVLYPFVSRTSNGDAKQDQVQTISTLRFMPKVDEKLFAVPPSTFTDASFPADQNEVKIPFLITDGRIEIEVSINGHAPLPFLLDTGAVNLLTTEAAKALDIQGTGNVAMSGTGEKQENAQFAKVASVRIGELEMRDQQFIVIPLPVVQDRGEKPKIAGLLGYELLRRFPATFNYSIRTLTFYHPETSPEDPQEALRLPLHFVDNSPSIEVNVNGMAGSFGIDTGDQGDITLFAPFYNAHRFPVLQPGLEIEQGGVGGRNKALRTRVAEIAVGPLKLSTPIVTLSFTKQGAFSNEATAGNLGYKFLRNFIFTLDYEHRIGCFRPSPEFGEPFSYNRSGLSLDRAIDGSVIVDRVDAGSPAARAGLQKDDQILRVNGEDPRPQALGSVEKLFGGEAGTRFDLLYTRKGKEAHALFTLEERLPANGVYKPLEADKAAK